MASQWGDCVGCGKRIDLERAELGALAQVFDTGESCLASCGQDAINRFFAQATDQAKAESNGRLVGADTGVKLPCLVSTSPWERTGVRAFPFTGYLQRAVPSALRHINRPHIHTMFARVLHELRR